MLLAYNATHGGFSDYDDDVNISSAPNGIYHLAPKDKDKKQKSTLHFVDDTYIMKFSSDIEQGIFRKIKEQVISFEGETLNNIKQFELHPDDTYLTGNVFVEGCTEGTKDTTDVVVWKFASIGKWRRGFAYIVIYLYYQSDDIASIKFSVFTSKTIFCNRSGPYWHPDEENAEKFLEDYLKNANDILKEIESLREKLKEKRSIKILTNDLLNTIEQIKYAVADEAVESTDMTTD
jgi:hypothetical protein